MDNKQTYIEKLWRDLDSKDQTIAALRAKLAEKDAEIASLNTKLIDASNQPGVNNINFDALWKIKGDLEVKLAEKERDINHLWQRDSVWRAKKEMLENDLAKAWKRLEEVESQLARYREGFRPIREVDAEILVACIGRQPSPNEQIKMGGSAIKAIRDCVMTLEALKAVEGEDAAVKPTLTR